MRAPLALTVDSFANIQLRTETFAFSAWPQLSSPMILERIEQTTFSTYPLKLSAYGCRIRSHTVLWLKDVESFVANRLDTGPMGYRSKASHQENCATHLIFRRKSQIDSIFWQSRCSTVWFTRTKTCCLQDYFCLILQSAQKLTSFVIPWERQVGKYVWGNASNAHPSAYVVTNSYGEIFMANQTVSCRFVVECLNLCVYLKKYSLILSP